MHLSEVGQLCLCASSASHCSRNPNPVPLYNPWCFRFSPKRQPARLLFILAPVFFHQTLATPTRSRRRHPCGKKVDDIWSTEYSTVLYSSTRSALRYVEYLAIYTVLYICAKGRALIPHPANSSRLQTGMEMVAVTRSPTPASVYVCTVHCTIAKCTRTLLCTRVQYVRTPFTPPRRHSPFQWH